MVPILTEDGDDFQTGKVYLPESMMAGRAADRDPAGREPDGARGSAHQGGLSGCLRGCVCHCCCPRTRGDADHRGSGIRIGEGHRTDRVD